MMAGAAGGTLPDFLARSAIAARYARFACNRRMHSIYSGLGFCAGLLGASEDGSADELPSCDPCCGGGPPDLPAAWRFTTSCKSIELMSSKVETRAFSRADWAPVCDPPCDALG